MSNKKSSKLGDIGRVTMCKRVLKHQTTQFGEIPFYKISTFGGKADSFIAKDLYDEFRENYSYPKKGDILISAAGTVGETVTYDGKPAYFQDSNIVWIDNDETKILNSYLYYFYQTKPWLTTNGSTIKRIYNDNLRSIEINYPESLQEQQKIAAVLSALDAKIELNQRINAELESMAKFVFRQWFVENKKIGNWKIGKLGDVAENIRRSANPDEIKPDTHYFGLEHMPRKSIALTDWGNSSELESNKYAFKEGEFLFGKLRPYFHKVGIAPVDGVCSTDILVIAPKSPEWYGFVLGHISSDELIKYADVTSGGTKMPRTNWTDLARFEIPMPPIETAKKYSEFFLPISQQIRTNILESQTLTELRDWLLPMLMNGQVKIK